MKRMCGLGQRESVRRFLGDEGCWGLEARAGGGIVVQGKDCRRFLVGGEKEMVLLEEGYLRFCFWRGKVSFDGWQVVALGEVSTLALADLGVDKGVLEGVGECECAVDMDVELDRVMMRFKDTAGSVDNRSSFL